MDALTHKTAGRPACCAARLSSARRTGRESLLTIVDIVPVWRAVGEENPRRGEGDDLPNSEAVTMSVADGGGERGGEGHHADQDQQRGVET